MEKIKAMMCKECDPLACPCLTTADVEKYPCSSDYKKWQPVTATINPKPAPEPEVFEFGDRVECGSKREINARYVSYHDGYHEVLVDGEKSVRGVSIVRRPLRERMRKGQPIASKTGAISIFKKFDERGENLYTISNGLFLNGEWRLPTQAELDEIGHGSNGWLTSEG